MNKPLATSIASMIALCVIGKPTIAFGEREPVVDTPTAQLGLEDPVAGEEAPDWSFLDDQDGPPASPAPPGTPSEVDPAPPAQDEPPAPPAGKPPVIPITDPNEELEIPPVQPLTEEEPVPDPEAEAAAKKKADEDAATAEAEKVAAKKAAAEKKPVADVKLPSEEEVDAMQPKPGASKQYVTDFRKFKDEVAKPALAEVKRLRTELEEAKKAPVISPEIQARLDAAEDDRKWREAFELENDPKITKEFEEKSTKAEESLYTLLRDHPRLKMSPEAVEKFKALGLDSDEGRKTRNDIVEAVKKLGDEFLLDEVKDAFKSRDNVMREKTARIEQLRSSQGSLTEIKAAREKEERISWAKDVDKHMIDLVRDKPEFLTLEVPADATKEKKDEIEAHNKKITDEMVPAMHAGIRAIHARDPKATLSHLINSLRVPTLEATIKAKEKELAAAMARVAELESDGTKLRRVVNPSRIDSAPAPSSKPAKASDVNLDMTADEAIDAFRKEIGDHQGTRKSRYE